MKLTPCKMSDIEQKTRMNLFELLTEFTESEHKCVEVEDYHHVSAYSCASALNKAAKRYRMFNIKVISSGGKVYLIKKL